MEQKYSKVVLLIITNKQKDKFYVQQKDENYYVEKWRLHHTFFGGQMDNNENPDEALEREMFEELEKGIAELVLKKSKKVFDFHYKNETIERDYYVYESILSDEELEKIAKGNIKEGKIAKIFVKEELKNIKIILSVKEIIEKYLSINL